MDVPRFPVPDEQVSAHKTSTRNDNPPLQKLHRVPRNRHAFAAQFAMKFTAAARELAGEEAWFSDARGPVGREREVRRSGH